MTETTGKLEKKFLVKVKRMDLWRDWSKNRLTNDITKARRYDAYSASQQVMRLNKSDKKLTFFITVAPEFRKRHDNHGYTKFYRR
mgnify:CR=1 FL=1